MRWLRSALMRLSITARITLGSLVIASLVGVVAVIGVGAGVGEILHNATITLLRYDAEPFEQALQTNSSDVDAVPNEGQYVALINPAGQVTMSTLPASLRPYGKVPLSSDESFSTVNTAKHSYLVRSKAVQATDGVWHVISARNQDANQLVLTRLTIALLITAVVLVGCFTLASYVLARTALRPVNVMRRQADGLRRRQSAGDDARRDLLEVPPVRDELAALAVTLNGLIEALRASADREKQLVSDASHELRTPLAVLRGELELAELDAGDADALLGDVRKAQRTVLRLSNLATNLLELSRIDQRNSSGATTWDGLHDELAAAIDRMRMAASLKRVDCTIDFEVVDLDVSAAAAPDGSPRSDSLDEQDDADEDALADGRATVGVASHEFGRLVDNLIGNAINAIGESGESGREGERGESGREGENGRPGENGRAPATITARLSREATFVELSVVDDGPGMPADFMPVALDRFTRADAARDTSTGSGLGLAIVAALVRAADGGIGLADTPGGGLTVTVAMPLSIDLDDEIGLDGLDGLDVPEDRPDADQ